MPGDTRRAMGSLEYDVLGVLWRLDSGGTPGEVLAELDEDLAYTTVMTILTRLWQKGLATRERQGRAFVYRAKVTEAELAVRRIQSVLASSRNRRAVLSTFVESLSVRDAKALQAALDELND